MIIANLCLFFIYITVQTEIRINLGQTQIYIISGANI